MCSNSFLHSCTHLWKFIHKKYLNKIYLCVNVNIVFEKSFQVIFNLTPLVTDIFESIFK